MDNIIFENTVISVKEITPANAAKLLDSKNKKNRNLSRVKVAEYVAAMQADEWAFNGDSIRIASNGILLDGQHRLTAVAQSGKSQHFVFIENMDSSVGMTIDNGKVRNGGDTLSLQANVKPSVAQTMSGALKIFYKHAVKGSISTSGGHKLTNIQIVDQYRNNKELVDFCVNWLELNVKKQGAILSKAEMLGILLILCDINKDEAIKFCEMVFCGLHINEVCSQSLLREYLLDCKSKVKKSDQSQRLASVIKVWNSVRAGRNITNGRNVIFRKNTESFKKAK